MSDLNNDSNKENLNQIGTSADSSVVSDASVPSTSVPTSASVQTDTAVSTVVTNAQAKKSKLGANKKAFNKKGLIILICLVVVAILSSFIPRFIDSLKGGGITYHSSGYAGRPNIPSMNSGFGISNLVNPYVAVLVVEGTIQQANSTYNQAYLLDIIDTLCSENNNYGILLYIDSPGGTVYEADELYLALEDYKNLTGRPVWAYFGSMAASGGYYIGCAAEMIIANRNTLTGSIGVIAGSSLDLTGLMDKYGIKMTTFTAGKNKNMMNYNSPVTPEQADIMQSVADEAYEQFTSIVADSRYIDIETVKKLADGRIYTAKQALENSLIDSISGFDEASDWMMDYIYDDYDVDCEMRLFCYEHKATFYDYVLGLASNIRNKASGLRSTDDVLPAIVTDEITPGIKYPAYLYKN